MLKHFKVGDKENKLTSSRKKTKSYKKSINRFGLRLKI